MGNQQTGGDIVGVEWDPYSGDHLLSFKYEADDEKWYYTETPLHTPFFDREWIAVVPGPLTVLGQTVEYVTFVRGGYPSKEMWLYSTDGLNYVQASSTFVDQTLSTSQQDWLKIKADKKFDWNQPNTETGITPLGKGRALAAPDGYAEGWALLDPTTMRWTGFTFPEGGSLDGIYQVDSAGRLHNVTIAGEGFTYGVSRNGGRRFKDLSVALPEHVSIENIDFKANKKVGVAAVAIHAHDRNSGNDRDYVFKFDIRQDKPRLIRRYEVGLGDVNGSSGVGAEVRFDFETVTILPDGRVAVSFYDTTTIANSLTRGPVIGPAVAIELKTRLKR